MIKYLTIFILLLFTFATGVSQDFPTGPPLTETDSLAKGDNGLFNESNKNTFRVLFSGNPGRAALYSLLLPGAGQLYNRRYWKIPIVFAGLGAVGYLFYENNKDYQDLKQEYVDNIDNPVGQTKYPYYIQAKKSREQSIFAVIGVHLFNVFDAYIDRHLIDFDMDDDLSIRLNTMPDGLSPIGLSLYYVLDKKPDPSLPATHF